MRKVLIASAFIFLGLALVLAFVSASYLPVVLLFLLSILSFLLGNRGNRYYNKGMKSLEKGGDEEFSKALAYFGKAMKAGLSPSEELVAASILLQSGELAGPMAALERLGKSRKRKTSDIALIALSMGWFQKGSVEKAIGLCETVRARGCADRSLYANLGTYYLKAGRAEDFQALMKDKAMRNLSTVAVRDFNAVSAALEGRWKKAGDILSAVFKETSPGYAAPYVHMALVRLHYGNTEDALAMLGKAKEVRFNAVGLYGKDMVEALSSLVEDDGKAAVATLYAHPREMLSGILPETVKAAKMPETPPEPLFAGEEEESWEEPDTELNEEDEAWIRKHNG